MLSKTLEVIKQGAFVHCGNMKINNLKIIESGTFLYCRKLDLAVPKSVNVSDNAFEYCSNVRLPKNP